MGISGGPKSYPDGLVYLLDPANTNSYSGIGNTVFNIVNFGHCGITILEKESAPTSIK
jgi:hypothetical protein